MTYKTTLILVLLLGILLLIACQFCIPTLFGSDGYLHMRMAQFIRDKGPRYDFHWARYSVFATHFSDKDFLYHVTLIPFTFLPNMIWAGKLSGCLWTLFLYLTFFWMLQRYCRVKVLIPVFLAMFLCSAPYLRDISQTRNMVVVMGLMLLFVHFLIQKKRLPLFITTVVYTLSHVSGPYLLLFAGLGELGRFINEREFQWKSLGVVALGLVTGFLIHPNFPNNFLIFYLNGVLVPIFALKWGLELGAEFFPIGTREFVLDYPFILIGVILLIALGASSKKKVGMASAVWLSVAAFFFVFSFFSQRYIVQGYPLMLIALASYASDWWLAEERFISLQKNKGLLFSLYAGVVLLFALIGVRTFREFRNLTRIEQGYNHHFELVGAWMEKNIPAGETIFHANWSDSQYLIGLNPRDDYFVTLDPIYMYYRDPKKYNLYRDIAFGRCPDPYAALKNEFHVRYGYVDKAYFTGLINQIRPDPRFFVMAEDGFGLVFMLK